MFGGGKSKKKLIKRSARLYLDQDVIKISLSSLASNPSAPNHLGPLLSGHRIQKYEICLINFISKFTSRDFDVANV